MKLYFGILTALLFSTFIFGQDKLEIDNNVQVKSGVSANFRSTIRYRKFDSNHFVRIENNHGRLRFTLFDSNLNIIWKFLHEAYNPWDQIEYDFICTNNNNEIYTLLYPIRSNTQGDYVIIKLLKNGERKVKTVDSELQCYDYSKIDILDSTIAISGVKISYEYLYNSSDQNFSSSSAVTNYVHFCLDKDLNLSNYIFKLPKTKEKIEKLQKINNTNGTGSNSEDYFQYKWFYNGFQDGKFEYESEYFLFEDGTPARININGRAEKRTIEFNSKGKILSDEVKSINVPKYEKRLYYCNIPLKYDKSSIALKLDNELLKSKRYFDFDQEFSTLELTTASSGIIENLIEDFYSIVKPKRVGTKKAKIGFSDAVWDRVNDRLMIFLQDGKTTYYLLALNSEFQLTKVVEFKVDDMAFLQKVDESNFNMNLVEKSEEWEVISNRVNSNAFGEFEDLENSFITIMNLGEKQILFVDDLKSKKTTIQVFKP